MNAKRNTTILLLLGILLLLAACAQEPTATPTELPATSAQEEATAAVEPTTEALLPLIGDTRANGENTSAETAYPAPEAYPAPQAGTEAEPADAYPGPEAEANSTPATSVSVPVPPLDTLSVGVELFTDGLEVPVGVASAGDGSMRLFLIDKPGEIRVALDGVLQEAPFLDIRGRVGYAGNEQGLLGLAFHPQFAENGFFFVNYTDLDGNTVVARFGIDAATGLGDPGSETVVLTQVQPAGNHNGGHLAFGPDGNLYIGLGDGGSAGDEFGNGQNGQTWLGSLLRLNVDELPYSIPGDNPFLNDPAVKDEIWAIGLRNPWRYSFDAATGDLYIGDVGQNLYEEIDFQPAGSSGGQNYGWPITEGTHCYGSESCDQSGLVAPIFDYDHSLGCSVTGGYVYRGLQYRELWGTYLFGDYCGGRIWGLRATEDGGWESALLAQTGLQLSSFGVDEAGEIYLTSWGSGEVYLLVLK